MMKQFLLGLLFTTTLIAAEVPALPEIPAGPEFSSGGTDSEGARCPETVAANYKAALAELKALEGANNGFIMPPNYETYCLNEPDYASRDRQQSDNFTEYFARVFDKRFQVARTIIDASRSMALCGDLSEADWLVVLDRLNAVFQKYIDEGVTAYSGSMRTMYNRFVPFLSSALYLNRFIAMFNMPLADGNMISFNTLLGSYYDEIIRQVRVDHELRYRPTDFIKMLRSIVLLGELPGFDVQPKLVELGKAMSFELHVQNRANMSSFLEMNYVTDIKKHEFSYTFFAPTTGDFVPWMQTNYQAVINFTKAEIVDEDMTGKLISPLSIYTQFKFSYEACKMNGKNAHLYLEKFGSPSETYEFNTDGDIIVETVPSFLDSWSKSTFTLNNLATFQNARNVLDTKDFVSLMFDSKLINLNPKVYDDVFEGRMPGLPMKARLKVDLYHTPK